MFPLVNKLRLGRGLLGKFTGATFQCGRCNGFHRQHQVVQWSTPAKSPLFQFRSVAVSSAESTHKSITTEEEALIQSHSSVEQQPMLLDLGEMTNFLLDRFISDYVLLRKNSRSLLGAFEKIVLTQSNPTQLLNDSRFRLLFVTLMRCASQLSAEEFYEMFNIMLHCNMLHGECSSDFRALRKLCVQVAFRLATLHVNRISLPVQVDIAYMLKVHEASFRREADTLYDAFAYQLQLLIVDRRDQFSKLKLDELAHVLALFSCSPRKQPNKSESKDAFSTEVLWTQIAKDASRRLGGALSSLLGETFVGAVTPTYEEIVEVLHTLVSSGVQNEPVLKSCVRFVQKYDEPLESRLAALRLQRNAQFMQLTRKFELDALELDSSSLAQIETLAYLEKWKRERMKLLKTLLILPVGLSKLDLMESVQCDLLRNPQLTLLDRVELLETYFKHDCCFESTALAHDVLAQLAVVNSDKDKVLFKRAIRVVLLHSNWSFLLADAQLLESFLDRILSLGSVDGDFEEQALRFTSLCRLKEMLEAANRPSDTLAKLNGALTDGDVVHFLECTLQHIASVSVPATQEPTEEVRQNELVAASLMYCDRRGLVTSGNDALERCLAAIAHRNATLSRLIPSRAALLDSIVETLRSFPIERLDLPATTTEASISTTNSKSNSMYATAKAPLRFADMFVTFSARQISMANLCAGLEFKNAESQGKPLENAVSSEVHIACPRVAIQVLDNRSYLHNVSKYIHPKRAILENLRAACAPDWCVIRITETEWRVYESSLNAKQSLIDFMKRSLILHILRLSS